MTERWTYLQRAQAVAEQVNSLLPAPAQIHVQQRNDYVAIDLDTKGKGRYGKTIAAGLTAKEALQLLRGMLAVYDINYDVKNRN